jgi:hypothetical protein
MYWAKNAQRRTKDPSTMEGFAARYGALIAVIALPSCSGNNLFEFIVHDIKSYCNAPSVLELAVVIGSE